MAHAASTNDLRVSSLFDFRQHVVLVTGGATGLGEMAAQAYVQNGARVIIASRKESELQKTSERLNKLGPGRCEYVVADLADQKGCVGLCEEVKKRVDRLTVLISTWLSASFPPRPFLPFPSQIHGDSISVGVDASVNRCTLDNTGATWGADYYNFPESGWDKLMALNVKSIFYMTVGLEPLLLKGATPDTPSRVINIASMAGIMTVDVTAGEEGGLSPPGTGTFSCKLNHPLSLPLHSIPSNNIRNSRLHAKSLVVY